MAASTSITTTGQTAPMGINRPIKPCLPEGLRSLLNSDKRTSLDAAEVATVCDAPWSPPAIDEKQRAWISAKALPELAAYLAPAEGGELTARITVLLSHFYVARLPPKAWEMMIEDWRKALSDLPMWAINAGCERWFEDEERKPTPAGIRRLAKAAVADAEEERNKLLRMVALPAPANRLSAAMHGKLPAAMVAKWIDPLAVELVDGGAIVRCPNSYHRQWVRDRHLTEIRDALAVARVWFLMPGESMPEPRNLTSMVGNIMPGTVKTATGRTSSWDGLSDNDIPRLRERAMAGLTDEGGSE